MSKMTNLEKLLEKSDKIELKDFEAKNSMTNIFSDVVEFIKRKTELERTKGNEYLFTPKMLHELFEINNSKYFADQLWTHSDNPKNIAKHPKNAVLFTSPRRSVYKLIVKSEKKSESENS